MDIDDIIALQSMAASAGNIKKLAISRRKKLAELEKFSREIDKLLKTLNVPKGFLSYSRRYWEINSFLIEQNRELIDLVEKLADIVIETIDTLTTPEETKN
jgi:replicative DNA helicase